MGSGRGKTRRALAASISARDEKLEEGTVAAPWLSDDLLDDECRWRLGDDPPGQYRGVRIRNPGEEAWFEYHCSQDHDSSDAPAWYRTQQPVKILSREAPGDEEAGYGYKVQFLDGHVHQTFDDELHDGPE